jgi:hypothetical protein
MKTFAETFDEVLAEEQHPVTGSADYIAWAQTWCPEPIAPEPVPLPEAAVIYDDVDGRLGDDAEHDEFLTRVLWIETAIRLARVGWTIEALEAARWPVPNTARVMDIIRKMPRDV